MSVNPEILSLDGASALDLLADPYMLADFDLQPAKRNVDLASPERGDGAVPIGAPWHDALVLTATLRIADTDMEAGLTALGALTQRVEDAYKLDDGMEVSYRPRGATSTSTLVARSGRILETPQESEGSNVGWWHQSPVVKIELVCDPFYYGAPDVRSLESSSSYYLDFDVEDVGGDVDAEVEVRIDTNSDGERRLIEWGIESRNYDPMAQTPLLVDTSTTLAAVSGTVSLGAVNGYAPATPMTLATTGLVTLSGRKRIAAFVDSQADVIWRIGYRIGARGTMTFNEWIETNIVTNVEQRILDLGVVDVGPEQTDVEIVVQTMTRIPYADSGYDLPSVKLRSVRILPAELYGRVAATDIDGDLTLVTVDDFSAASGSLNSDSPLIGPAWVTGGDGSDFQAGGLVDSSDSVTRATVSDASGVGQFAYSGSSDVVDVRAKVRIGFGALGSSSLPSGVRCGPMIRKSTSTSDRLLAAIVPTGVNGTALDTVRLAIFADPGTGFEEIATTPDFVLTSTLEVEVEAWGDGLYYASVSQRVAADEYEFVADIAGHLSYLVDGATGSIGGGRAGFYDEWGSAITCTRTYSGFESAELLPRPPLVDDGEYLYLDTDKPPIRDDGSDVSQVGREVGAKLLIPPAGDAGRTTRMVFLGWTVDPAIGGLIGGEFQAIRVLLTIRPRYRNPLP